MRQFGWLRMRSAGMGNEGICWEGDCLIFIDVCEDWRKLSGLMIVELVKGLFR